MKRSRAFLVLALLAIAAAASLLLALETGSLALMPDALSAFACGGLLALADLAALFSDKALLLHGEGEHELGPGTAVLDADRLSRLYGHP